VRGGSPSTASPALTTTVSGSANGAAPLVSVMRATLPRRGGRALRALLLDQLAAQDLPDEGLGKRIAELDVARDLVRGQRFAAVLDELGRRRRRAGPQHHEGLDLFALDRVGNADRRRLGDSRMRREDLLDIARPGLEPGDDDHFLLAVDDVEVA